MLFLRGGAGLAFATFYIDGGVPADDELSSLTARGGAPGGPDWPVAFTTTHWSVVLTAQDESPAAYERSKSCAAFTGDPIFSFAQRQGFGREEAKDITQGFFAQLLERRSFSAVRKEKGRLRLFCRGAEILSGRRAPSRKRD